MFSRRSFLKHVAGAFALTAMPFPKASHAAAPISSTRMLMGTFVTLSVSGVSASHASEAMEQAFLEMARLEGVLTRYDSASALGTLNTSGRISDSPVELLHVVQSASRIHRQAGGFFDPTVLPLLEARQAGTETREAAHLVGMGRVDIAGHGISFAREGMKMSLDGIAKGHIADAGAAVLQRLGVRDFLIDAGGDIVARGSKAGKPWKIAVQDPAGQGAYPAVLSLRDCAVATSGTYERGQHIVDPVGGTNVSVASATVIAPTAMEADALATALCVMPDPIAFIDAMPSAACLVIGADGRRRCSSRWPA